MFWKKYVLTITLTISVVFFVPIISYAGLFTGIGGLFGGGGASGSFSSSGGVSGALPFGGFVYMQKPCNVGWALMIGPPTPGTYLYVPGASRLYLMFSPHVGHWLLGNYSPGGVCILGVCPKCIITPIDATIQMLGTS